MVEHEPAEDLHPEIAQIEKQSMDVEDYEEAHSAVAVEPIMVNLYQHPSR